MNIWEKLTNIFFFFKTPHWKALRSDVQSLPLKPLHEDCEAINESVHIRSWGVLSVLGEGISEKTVENVQHKVGFIEIAQSG